MRSLCRKPHEPKEKIIMDFAISISGFLALYIFMLAAFAGWVIIGHVPAILHTPLMSGSNFVHGIVVGLWCNLLARSLSSAFR
jgi:NAD/NADP transhydrogenase alpha subunit